MAEAYAPKDFRYAPERVPYVRALSFYARESSPMRQTSAFMSHCSIFGSTGDLATGSKAIKPINLPTSPAAAGLAIHSAKPYTMTPIIISTAR
ncbi:hypothetical protein DFR59_10766 [Falsibacillus pallidus]|uniref:Uncharacterized protein n=1 Tax=Falsibacillus pallidus TaxID=493781 RepID=A0A370GI64_9BACI|nr:hypothetical protein DFR59_10766 [Falsibacillus pallidus]